MLLGQNLTTENYCNVTGTYDLTETQADPNPSQLPIGKPSAEGGVFRKRRPKTEDQRPRKGRPPRKRRPRKGRPPRKRRPRKGRPPRKRRPRKGRPPRKRRPRK